MHERSDGGHFDGGRSEKGYHGGGRSGEDGPETANATTRGGDDYSDQGGSAAKAGPEGSDQQPHAEETRAIWTQGGSFDVVETSQS